MNTLIIEDSKTIAHILAVSLSAYGFITEILPGNAVNLGELSSKQRDIIIINTNLTTEKTEKIFQLIKEAQPDTIIIGITTAGKIQDKIDFLNMGGDDILAYPFPMQELLARIQSLLRRPRSTTPKSLQIDKINLDPIHKKAFLKKHEVNLRRKEFSLLEYMARNKNRVISRSELLDHVWDYRRITSSNTVDVHIKKLRDKLDAHSMIKTIHGFGYKLCDSSDKDRYNDGKGKNGDEDKGIPELK